MTNSILDTIKNRRSVVRFADDPVEDEKIEAILEAGRWAPSWLNKQPWSFILVENKEIREQLSEVVPTVFVQGLKEAPVCIVVVVDAIEDPFHFVEDGAAATQNMALAAHSLGLSSCWMGIFNPKNQKGSSEDEVRKILKIPNTHRVVALLPIGFPQFEIQKKERKTLNQLVYRNKFGKR